MHPRHQGQVAVSNHSRKVWRGCLSKKAHPSRWHAEQQICGRKRLSCYKCDCCGMWHLTSKPALPQPPPDTDGLMKRGF